MEFRWSVMFKILEANTFEISKGDLKVKAEGPLVAVPIFALVPILALVLLSAG